MPVTCFLFVRQGAIVAHLPREVRIRRLTSLLVAIGSLLPTQVLAQWQPGGVPVCGDCQNTIEEVFRAVLTPKSWT